MWQYCVHLHDPGSSTGHHLYCHQCSQRALQMDDFRHRRYLLLITCLIAHISALYYQLFLTPRTSVPYHMSALTGHAWVLELLTGHPDWIRHNLGVNLEVYEELLQVLKTNGYVQSRNGVTVEEQLAIFIYMCVTGLSTHHVGEHFQCSSDMISR